MSMKKRLFNQFLLLLLLPGFAFSQAMNIRGKVTESNGDPVFGANVVIKGTDRGGFDR